LKTFGSSIALIVRERGWAERCKKTVDPGGIMRKLVIVPVLAALATASPAAAKEISAARICGVAACVTSTDKAALMRLAQSSGPLASADVPKPSAYYKIRLQMREPGHGVVGGWDVWWVPSGGALAAIGESGSPQWSSVGGAANEFLKQRTAGLAPFPKPRLARVVVGTRLARDPNSYLALFDPSWPMSPDSASDWEQIVLTPTAGNPWSSHARLRYSPSKRLLWRGAEYFVVPGRIAANIEAARSLDAAPAGRSYAWAWAAGAVALLSVVAATVRRRRRG
jgi:hypothetical protein